MAISDKVIELETKKKGRTVVFIILIAVLAAASAAFAVLWILKTPATDPPSIEKVVLYGSNLPKQGVEEDTELDVYTVTPGNTYEAEFNLVLKEGSTVDNTNSLVTVSTQPSDGIVKASTPTYKLLTDEESGSKMYSCKLSFAVDDKAEASKIDNYKFDIIVTSEYSVDKTKLRIPCVMSTSSFTEHFDIINQTLVGMDDRSQTIALRCDEEKSGDNLRYYTGKLVYYEKDNAGSMTNQLYQVDLEQLGKDLGYGSRARVYKGVGNEWLDRVKVEVGVGDNYETAKYVEATEGGTYNGGISVSTNVDTYCHSKFALNARNASSGGYIRLTANAFNSSDIKPVIIIELDITSSNDMNEVTEIVFVDPYDGSYIEGKEAAAINFYQGTENSFKISDFIKVKRGGSNKIEDASWDTGGLIMQYYESPVKSFDLKYYNGMQLDMLGTDTKNLGANQFIVQDTVGFKTYRMLVVNVLSPVKSIQIDGRTDNKTVINSTSGESETFKAELSLDQKVKYSDVKDKLGDEDALNAAFTVKYPDSLKPLDENSKKGDEDGTVTMDRMDGLRIHPVISDGSSAADNKFVAEFTLNIGANVPTDDYKFIFTLDAQGVKALGDGKYQASEKLTFEVTLHISHLANSVSVNSAFINSLFTNKDYVEDKYTEVSEIVRGDKEASATLTIGIGTGTGAITKFTLGDMLNFYDEDGKALSADNDISVNRAALVLTDGDKALHAPQNADDIVNYRFNVPTVSSGTALPGDKTVVISLGSVKDAYKLTLTVEYRKPVTKVEALGPEVQQPEYYPDVKGHKMSNGNPVSGDINNTDRLGVYTVGGNAITSVSEIKHPELLQQNIAVISATTARVLLPRYESEDGTVYFFEAGEDISALYVTKDGYADWNGKEKRDGESFEDFRARIRAEFKEKAVFLVGYSNPLDNYNITIRRDLFELSYKANKAALDKNDGADGDWQLDYQHILSIYSYGTIRNYGDPARETDIMTLNERGVISNENKDGLFSAVSWNLVRMLDDVRYYTDDSYTEEMKPEQDGKYPSQTFFDGQEFTLYYSGVIKMSDGTEYVVERNRNVYNFECDTIRSATVNYTGADANYLTYTSSTDSFVGAAPNDRVMSGAVVTYSGAHSAASASMEISIANTAVAIKSVELFLVNPVTHDDARPIEDFSALDYTLFAGGSKGTETFTVYYRVTWDKYDVGDSAFESFSVSLPRGISASASPLPSFKIESVNIEYGQERTHVGNITFTAGSGVNIGDYDFGVIPSVGRNNGLAKSGRFKVTKLINNDFGALPDGDADGKVGVTVGGQTTPDFECAYSASGDGNVHTLEFNFAQTGVDKANLTFSANVINGINGVFYADGREYEHKSSADTFGPDKGVLGYRFTVTDRRVSAKLTITVVESYSFYNIDTAESESRSETYTIEVNIRVDVPVTDLKLTLKKGNETAIAYEKGSVAEFVSDGRKDESGADVFASYTLGSIVNEVTGEDDNAKLPFDTTATFSLPDDYAGTAFKLEGNVLKVNTSCTVPESTTLTVAVGGVKTNVTLSLKTDKRGIRFRNGELASNKTVTDNEPMDFGVIVFDAGDTERKEVEPVGTVTYTANVINGVTVAPESQGSSVFTISGSSGSFTVTATYEYTLLGKKDTVTITSGVITVNVGFKDITVRRGDTAIVNNGTVHLLVGQTTDTAFAAAVRYTVTDLPATTIGLTAVSNNDCVTVSAVNGGAFTLAPKSAGTAQITVSRAGVADFKFTVTVGKAPSVAISFTDSHLIDVFSSDGVEIAVAKSDFGEFTMTNLVVTAESDLFKIEEKGGKYVVTLDSSADDFAQRVEDAFGSRASFYVTASASVEGYPEFVLNSNRIYVGFESSYKPVVTLSRNNGTVESNGIDKAAVTDYVFTVNLPERFDASVKFTTAALTLSVDGNRASVTGLTSGYVGTGGEISVNVTVLGVQYVTSLRYTLTDGGSITSKLYYSSAAINDINSVFNATGSVKLSEITDDVSIDYSGSVSSAFVAVVIDYSAAPAAVLNANADSFIVSAGAELTSHMSGGKAVEGIVEKGGKHYYVKILRADRTGTAIVAAYTKSVGGSAYQAEPITVTFTATEPDFKINKVFASLAPGGNTDFAITHASDFKGTVKYAWSMTNANGVLNATGENSATYTVTANGKNLNAETNATVKVVVTVEDGVFDGYVCTFTAAVNVAKYTRPTLTHDRFVWIESDAADTVDLKDYFEATSDPSDSLFAYGLTFSLSPNGNASLSADDGTLSGTKFTPKRGGGARNLTLYYTASVTGGVYNGEALTGGSILVIVAPTVSLTAPSTPIVPTQTARLDLSVGNNSTDVTVVYRVMPENAGTVSSDGVFTPKSGFSGTATVYAAATLTYSGERGNAKEVSATVTVLDVSVTLLNNFNASARPGESIDMSDAFTLGSLGVNSQDATSYKFTCSDPYVTGSGSSLAVDINANRGDSDRQVTVHAQITKGGVVYDGDFTFTVLAPGTKPTLTLDGDGYENVTNTNQGKLVYTLSEGFTATYDYAVIGDGVKTTSDGKLDLDNLGRFTYDRGTEDRNATVIITATIAGGTYAGTVLTARVDIAVEKAQAPDMSSTTLTLSATNPSSGTLTLSGKPANVTVLSMSSGSSYLKVDGSGSCVLAPDHTENKTVKVTVYYTVNDADDAYYGVTLSKEYTVMVLSVGTISDTFTFTRDTNSRTTGIFNTAANGYTLDVTVPTGANYITVTKNDNGRYVYTLKGSYYGKTITVRFTATNVNYPGLVVTRFVNVSGADDALSLTVTGAAENGTATGGTLSYSLTDGYAATYRFAVSGEGITVSSPDNYTALSVNYTYVKGTEERRVKITVYATVTTESHAGTVLTASTEITVPKAPEPPVETEPGLADNALVYDSILVSGNVITARVRAANTDKITVTYYSANSEFLTVNADGTCIVKPASEKKTVPVTVHYVVTAGAYAGKIGEKNYNVDILPLVPLGDTDAPVLDGENKLIEFAPAGYTVATPVVTKGGEYVEVENSGDGKYEYKLLGEYAGKEAEITFTAESTNYSGYTVVYTVQIPTGTAPSDNEETEPDTGDGESGEPEINYEIE